LLVEETVESLEMENGEELVLRNKRRRACEEEKQGQSSEVASGGSTARMLNDAIM
jgi:hypothetical protein